MSVLLLEHKEDLIQCVTQLRPITEFLETAKEEFLTGAEKRVTVSSVSFSLLNSEHFFFFLPLLCHVALFALQCFIHTT